MTNKENKSLWDGRIWKRENKSLWMKELVILINSLLSGMDLELYFNFNLKMGFIFISLKNWKVADSQETGKDWFSCKSK